jgi:hypothetical protein
MGGFASALGDLAAKGVEHIGDALTHVRAVGSVLEGTEGGAVTKQLLDNHYIPSYKQSLSVQLEPELRARTGPDGKPRPNMPPIDMKTIHSNAAKYAREQLAGKGDSFLIQTAQGIEKKHGIKSAQVYADTMAFILKDNTQGQLKNGATTSISTLKSNMMKAGVGLKNADPTWFPKTGAEKAVTNAMYQAFSPLIVIPHATTVFNGLFGSDPATFIKGAFHTVAQTLESQPDKWHALIQSGAFAESHIRDAMEYNQFQATGKPQFTGSGAARIVYKMFHQPGFASLRDMNLLMGANTGKMVAEQAAMDFARNPQDQKLAWVLKEYGLDPQQIIENKGILNGKQTDLAVFRFIDKHYFLDNTLQRSRLLQATPLGRMLGMYHGYVTRQAKLMGNAMFLDFKNQGAGTTLKNLAIGAILFPLLGEGVQVVQESVRGQDAIGDLEKDVQNIEGKRGSKLQAETYFKAMGHVAAFGVYQHMLRGALHHSLAETLIGPAFGSGIDLAQDTVGAASNIGKGKHVQKSLEPVERDLAYDTPGVSLLAQIFANRVIPKRGTNPRKTTERRIYHSLRHEDQYGDPIQTDDKEK